MDQDYGIPVSPQPAYPYYGPPVYTRPPRRRRTLAISLIALLMAAIILVSVVLALNGAYRLHGNAGVVAAYDYFCAYMQQTNSLTGGTPSPAITKRLGSEPFEMECALSVTSDQFEDSGLPLTSIPIGIDAKYDMNDLGVKMSVMGFQALSAYVIEDEFVVNIAGKAGSTQIGLPVEADLSQPMALPERLFAFLPFLSGDHNELYFKVLEAFAQSVPDEYTRTYTLDIYSPAAGRDVKTEVVETQLDSAAITEVVRNLADRLQDDEALCEEVQAIADEVTSCFSLDPVDVVAELDRLEKLDESAVKGVEFSWEVYRREGRCTGISVSATQPDTGTTTMLSEFYQNVFYTSNKVDSPFSTAETYSKATHNGSHTDIEAQSVTEFEYMKQTIRETGSMDSAQIGPDEYTYDLNFTMDTQAEFTEDVSEDTRQTMDFTGDITFRFGKDLKTLRESSGWDDIYKKEWGTLEDTLGGLNTLGEMLGSTLDLT